MQKTNKYISRIILLFLTSVIILLSLPTSSFASYDFEASINSFPESYKPYLRKLHSEYPEWEFIPLETGLDWDKSVEAQFADNKSLVTASTAYTDIYRSKEADDYNYKTGSYIQKDAGFVRGNRLAVSYFMDPRNFLTPEGIFQFEKLSFDSSITVEDVESILNGSFMHKTKITYIGGKIKKSTDDTTGETVYKYVISDEKKKSDDTYAEVFFAAGKKYNVNPCFLAAKAINEVGTDGTNSVSGKQENYPGIYNFYNVGAYDGANPIDTGLRWASSNGTYAPSTYQRPWTTPKKSIMGGAEFNAEKYINAGQYTSYLQRFNVDPQCEYKVYTHQYMTNLPGAAAPAYQTYKTYLENDLINNKFIFVIPIYNNMPSHNITSGSVYSVDGFNQTGKINTDCNVRKGPSVDSQLAGIQLTSGTEVTILETVETDTKVTDNIMRYPYWCKIKFTHNGKSKTGYVYSNFITLITQTLVGAGSYVPPSFSTSPELTLNYISDNVNVADIKNNKTVNFKTIGKTVNITAYNSTGNYNRIKYKVVKDVSKYTVENIKIHSITHSSAKVIFDKNDYFNSYEVFVSDTSGNLVQKISTSTNSATAKNLEFSTEYTVSVRGYKNTSTTKNYGILCGYVPFTTNVTPEKPQAATGITAVNENLDTVLLTWNAVIDADGYSIYTYDINTNNKVLITEVSSTETVYRDTSLNALKETKYIVCSYKIIDDRYVYSDDSEIISYIPPEIVINKISTIYVSDYSSDMLTLSWNKSDNAEGYNVYKYNPSINKFEKIAYTNDNFYTVNELSSASEYQFIVKPAIEILGKLYEGDGIKIITRTSPETTAKISLADVTTKAYKLKWQKVEGATGYRVYIYDTKTKKYKKYKSTTKTYMNFSKLTPGKKTYYKIMSYSKKGEKIYYGELSDSFRATTKPAKVKSIKASEIKTTSVKLTWNKSEGATGYRVYSYNSKKGTYKLVGKTTKNYVTIKKLSRGKTYKFIVRSISKTQNCKYYGASSSKITVTTKK